MTNKRLQKQLNQSIVKAYHELDWEAVRDLSQALLAVDKGDRRAVDYLAAAERALSVSDASESVRWSTVPPAAAPTNDPGPASRR